MSYASEIKVHTDAIVAIKARRTAERLAKFDEFLISHFGRIPVVGDRVIVDDQDRIIYATVYDDAYIPSGFSTPVLLLKATTKNGKPKSAWGGVVKDIRNAYAITLSKTTLKRRKVRFV